VQLHREKIAHTRTHTHEQAERERETEREILCVFSETPARKILSSEIKLYIISKKQSGLNVLLKKYLPVHCFHRHFKLHDAFLCFLSLT